MGKRISNLAIVGIVIVVLVGGFETGHVSAQTPQASPPGMEERVSKSFEFYPKETGFGTYVDVSIESGASAELEVLLANTGDVTQSFTVYPVNAFTAEGGGFAVAEQGKPATGTTTWIDLSQQQYSLESAQGVEITIFVQVPDGTAPGEYMTALAAEQSEGSEVEGTSAVLQKLRYIIPVYITVPGEMATNFEVGAIDLTNTEDAILVSVDLANTGDRLVRPKGSIDISDADGNAVASIPVEMQSIYAHDETTLTLPVPTAIPAGSYVVTVGLQDPESKVKATGTSDVLEVLATGTPETPTPVQIMSSSIQPGPSAESVQFISVEATVANTGEPITNGQLSLLVRKDGEQVERFPISQSLSLPQGETEVSTRYIPAEGFTTGTWTFELLIETVDASGAAVVQASQPIEGSVVIP